MGDHYHSLFQDYVSALRSTKGKLDYICELSPPPGHRLSDLLRDVRWIASSSGEAGLHDQVLAWAAALFCYERESEGGFVEPFVTTVGYPLSDARAIWNQDLGPRIRRALSDWCGTTYEVGFMKYVGQVRVHAGVPKPLEPRLADVLYALAIDSGLDQVSQLTRHELDDLIDRHFGSGRFAKEYLHSDAGRSFLVSCAIHLHRAGWPGQVNHVLLDQEPGYRKGFFADLYRHLHAIEVSIGSPARKRTTPKDLVPELFLDLASYRVGLRFPGLKAKPACTYDIDGRRHVRGALFPGDLLQISRGRYEGLVWMKDEGHPWSVPAWPRAKSSWALFTTEGEWVGCEGDHLALPEGTYLAAIHLHRAQTGSITGSLGYLDPCHEDFGEFELVEVEHGPEAAMPGVAILTGRGAVPRPILQQTQSEQRLSALSGSQIVFGDRIRFMLEPWTDGDSRYFSVINERGDERYDLTHEVRVIDNLGWVELPAGPHEGTLRIEARGRHADKPGRALHYTLWPESTRIEFDQSIYGVGETARVDVKTDSSVTILPTASYEAAVSQQEVTFELSVDVEEGRDPLQIDITVPIPRASLRAPGVRGELFILDPVVWAEKTRQIGSGDGVLGGLVLSVRGDEPWSLRLEKPDGHFLTLMQGDERVRYPARVVRHRLAYSTIQTQISQAGPIGRFQLLQAGRSVDLGAILLDSSVLRSGPTPLLPDWLPASFKASLGELRTLQGGSMPTVPLENCPSCLEPVLLAWRKIARVIAGDSERLEGQAAVLASLVGQSEQDTMAPSAASALVKQLDEIELSDVMCDVGLLGVAVPPFLQTATQLIRDRVAARADTHRVISLGIGGVFDRIAAGSAVPPPLQQALRCYQDAFSAGLTQDRYVKPIVRSLKHVSRKSEPWYQVSKALFAITLLRMGYVADYLNNVKDGMPGVLVWMRDQLQNPAFACGYQEGEWDLDDATCHLDDTAICQLCLGLPHESPSCPSWLYLYMAWRISGNADPSGHLEDADLLAPRLLGDGPGALPKSIDARALHDEVSSGSPRVWSTA